MRCICKMEIGGGMEDFLNSERFEQMAREYNAKYRQANVLEKVFDRAGQENVKESPITQNEGVCGEDFARCNLNNEMGKRNTDNLRNDSHIEIAGNKMVAEVLGQIMSLVKLCEWRTCGNVRFLSTNNIGEKLLEKIHKTALDNDLLLEKRQNGQIFWGNNKIFVQKFIEIEKFFAKNKEIAKVQCLCDIHEMMLNYLDSFCGRN